MINPPTRALFPAKAGSSGSSCRARSTRRFGLGRRRGRSLEDLCSITKPRALATSPSACVNRNQFDNTMNKNNTSGWLRYPRVGDRCPISGLSRSTLAELVRPCPRNGYNPPVESKLLKRDKAGRGVVLISRKSLLDYIENLPTPSAADWMKDSVEMKRFPNENHD